MLVMSGLGNIKVDNSPGTDGICPQILRKEIVGALTEDSKARNRVPPGSGIAYSLLLLKSPPIVRCNPNLPNYLITALALLFLI